MHEFFTGIIFFYFKSPSDSKQPRKIVQIHMLHPVEAKPVMHEIIHTKLKVYPVLIIGLLFCQIPIAKRNINFH